MGSGESKPVNKSVFGSPAPVLGSPVASYGAPGGGRRRSNRRGNRRGRGKTMRGGQCKKTYGGMHKGKRHSKGSRRNKSKSRSNRSRHH
jgi:hypothetical protein